MRPYFVKERSLLSILANVWQHHDHIEHPPAETFFIKMEQNKATLTKKKKNGENMRVKF